MLKKCISRLHRPQGGTKKLSFLHNFILKTTLQNNGLGRPWPALAGQGRPWPAMAGQGTALAFIFIFEPSRTSCSELSRFAPGPRAPSQQKSNVVASKITRKAIRHSKNKKAPPRRRPKAARASCAPPWVCRFLYLHPFDFPPLFLSWLVKVWRLYF